MANGEEARMTDEQRQQRRANLRLGLILGSIAIAFFVGFIVKSALFGI
jgi:hypothetical protein